ncbi:MAG: hypothetical protein PVG83_10990 [Acidimicrobiia bacterium]
MAGAFCLAQLLILDSSRFLTWDEAVYLSEVSPHVEAIGMGAHRARGTTFVVAPVAFVSDSMTVLRVYLAVVSGLGLYAAFAVWTRTIRWAAPIACAIFGSSWLVVFYGSAVYPNLYSALLAVAAIGVAFWIEDVAGRGVYVVLAGLVTLAALVRPLDALILAMSLMVVGLITRGPRLSHLALTVAIGLGVGALPWAIEGWARFGDPLQRLELARQTVGGGLYNNVADYLHALDGSPGPVNRGASVNLLVLVALGVGGLLGGERRTRRVGFVALASSVMFVSPYLFATEPVIPRFVLPGLALLSVAAGVGVTSLASRLGNRTWAVTVLAVALAVILVWNIPALVDWSDRQNRNTETALALGEAIGEESADDCFFMSPINFPGVSFASGCRGASLGESVESNQVRAREAREAGSTVFAVTTNPDPGEVLGAGWVCRPVSALAERGWQLCAQ